ncbi:hypothetical protein D3C87_51840 [compost metagenome]
MLLKLHLWNTYRKIIMSKTRTYLMKRNLLAIFLTFITLAGSAQHLIKGKVIDEDNQPVISASILLQKKSEKSIVQTSITDSIGVFLLNPKQTLQHQLVISAIGFESTFVDLPDALHQDTILLVRLTRQGKQLKEVNIYMKAPLIVRKTDRILFNVENSLSAIGGDGIDALSKAPGVRVNDNGINIVGKNSIKIMVNDKLIQLSGVDLISYVKSIPSGNIKRIEIITNPSARYEADGNSGLINIVLKQNGEQGFNGMINTGGIIASRYTAGLTGIFNYNQGKLHLSSNLSGVYLKIESKSFSAFSGPKSLWERQLDELTTGKGGRGDIRVDYDLTANTIIGVKYMEGARHYTIDSKEDGAFYATGRLLDSTLVLTSKDKLKYTLRNFEFYLDHKIDTSGKKIEFTSNYFKYGTIDNNHFQSKSYTPELEFLNNYQPVGLAQDERFDIFSSKLDLSLPYKFASLELGAKISNIKSKNDLVYEPSSDAIVRNNNLFDYKENTQSLYATADKNFNKWSMKLGLRMEMTQTTGRSSLQTSANKNDYVQLFPTFYLKHSPNENNAFSFTYGRRINRPDYSLLNPARLYSAVNVYEEGNPFLKPSFSNNFELNYNYKDWLSTSVYSNFVSNGFSPLDFFDPQSNIQSRVQRNYANSVAIGLSETLTINKISWWENNNQLNIYMERSKSNGAIAEGTLKQWSGYVSTDNTFTLNTKKTLMANATFWYQFPEVANRLISSAYYATDLSLRAMFMDRKLTFSLNSSDIFKTSQRKYKGIVNGVHQFNTAYKDNRKTMISILYRFGNSKGNKASRNTDDTETNRIKQGI